ncbi:MAG: 30S ribosomal protein S9 [Bdellovibrionales bacterium]
MAKAAAKEQYIYATGRRKTSAARVFLKRGTGEVTVNEKPLDKYMSTPTAKMTVLSPLVLTDTKNQYDARVTVVGGGVTGQSEAIRHGIARALVAADANLRPTLKKAGLLTRDSRMVERKKYGKHGARRSTQFSKR